jgi:hypothetical protein
MAKGDHIFIEGHLYDHHGIDCGDDTVIHYSGSIKGGTGRIVRDSKSRFAQGKQIKIKNYEYKYSASEIVNRAERRLRQSHTEGYNIVFNNCEQFAYDCTIGKADSWQLNNAGASAVGVGVVGAGLAAATTEVAAGGILGFLGATTTVAAFPMAAVVGGAAIAGAAVYKGLKWLDNND